MTRVMVEPDESFESALKRFKTQCEKAGLLSEVKKASARRKRTALAARKNATRRERLTD